MGVRVGDRVVKWIVLVYVFFGLRVCLCVCGSVVGEDVSEDMM